ncbi:HCP-like protein [Aaosphaeria arxii CBS 175.79]|uniref:HCP-like protein n=1 Tax=Aaosphaeria arxii CBS 175.79 TaxID=1450172 RepID=A0A6A5XX65_9PLEO|nr:HCP-like protein [Aaosphaeria arxii CBS 175.79]KAF2017915.1 HCP-like protein [Aaosphaeria arxii CBS 175.79]
MKPRLPRPQLVPLFFVILSFLLCLSLAEVPENDPRLHAQTPLKQEPPPPGSWGAKIPKDGETGASSFEEASQLLRKIRPASAPWYDFDKKNGIFGATAYYAKELFFLLFMNGPPQPQLLTSSNEPKKLSPTLEKAVKLLEESAAARNPDALFVLAELNFWGNHTHPRNYQAAFKRYHELAMLNGNASAQHMVGFMYATGIGGAVPQDQAKAMMYHMLAAEGGDIRSEMTMAYRYSSGIATPRNCEESVYYYKSAADKAMAYMRSGPPGGHSMLKEAYRIADDEGGVYGEGASVASSGPNAKQGGVHSDTFSSLEDVFEYMDLQARKGDPRASFNLAKLNYDGARNFKRDLQAAKKRFLDLARMYWPKEGKAKQNVSPVTEKLAAKAAGYLGRMFSRGEGMPQSFSIAHTWFKRGVELGDALSQYSLGLLYLEGLGVEQDAVKAANYFGAAADQDFPAAQVRMGALFLDQGDIPTALEYFGLAARHGHMEAYYYLAEMTHNGVGKDKSCAVASAYYKIVAENAEVVSTAFPEANDAYAEGDLETALVGYMMAAEQGFEIGQANVAYLLDQAKPRFTLNSLIPFLQKKATLAGDAFLALIYWTRSAEQKNIDSMVKLGDYYLNGLGTKADAEKAAACYQAAADSLVSAQAMWNLGWMHENGIGIEQDFHLAKRNYDLALETNPREAHVPVLLALYKLRFRSWWNTITNGDIKSIQEEPVEKKEWSLSEWLNAFLEAEIAGWEYEQDDYEGGHMPGGDYDEALDEIDSELIDSLVILGLTGALVVLLWYRVYRQRRREQELRQQADQLRPQQGHGGQAAAQPQNPFQPQDLANWAAGGLGL